MPRWRALPARTDAGARRRAANVAGSTLRATSRPSRAIVRAIHLAHAAGANEAANLVRPEDGARYPLHGPYYSLRLSAATRNAQPPSRTAGARHTPLAGPASRARESRVHCLRIARGLAFAAGLHVLAGAAPAGIAVQPAAPDVPRFRALRSGPRSARTDHYVLPNPGETAPAMVVDVLERSLPHCCHPPPRAR